ACTASDGSIPYRAFLRVAVSERATARSGDVALAASEWEQADSGGRRRGSSPLVSAESRISRAVRLRPIRERLRPNAAPPREDAEAMRGWPEGAGERALVEQREPIWPPDHGRLRLSAVIAVRGRFRRFQ